MSAAAAACSAQNPLTEQLPQEKHANARARTFGSSFPTNQH
jgi:hypothetical protein